MLINGCKTLVIRCRFCGRLEKYSVNLFSILENKEIKYRCRCGDVPISFRKTMDNQFQMRVNCFNCGKKHTIKLKLKDILIGTHIPCCFYGTNLCFIGDEGRANQILLENQISIGRCETALYGEEYFNNFKVFSKALNHLSFLNSRGRINCNCGKSDIRVDLFPDRLELKCNNCNSVKIIFAETEQDLSILMKRDKISLREHNISCIDSIGEENKDLKE